MLGHHKLIIDEWCEVWRLLEPYADASFWQWPDTFDDTAFYIVGRTALERHRDVILPLAQRYPGQIIFANPAEGSQTILMQMARHGITQLVHNQTMGLIAAGNLEPGWSYCQIDYFTDIVEYDENCAETLLAALKHTDCRPYDFLFLNGRLRPHRKYLIDGLQMRSLLNRALWSNLESQVTLGYTSQLVVGDTEPIRLLPAEYELARAVPRMANLPTTGNVKTELFGNTWGDGVVNHLCYTDTWFSLVSETVFDYPYSFRTEKIWKPIMMGHPFVVAANPGFYRDLRNAGFCTFDSIIDESFDQIDCPQARLECIITVIDDICANGPDKFWTATRDICKYNRDRLIEYNQEQRSQFPDNLRKYLDERS